MAKNREIKTEKEEPYFKWCYGKFIKCGTIKTEDKKFLDLLEKVREIRKEHLRKIVDEKAMNGEICCMSKHLLA